MFEWLRNKVKNAVLAGVNDAVEYLEDKGASKSDDAERLLEERVILQLPSPNNDKQDKRKKGV